MRDPDYSHGSLRAWKLAETAKSTPDHEASLGAWLLTGPFHPWWMWWMVSMIHLRDLPGVRPAVKQYPEAAYEFLVMSIDPGVGTPDLAAIERGDEWAIIDDRGERHKFLVPPDVVVQFDGCDDDTARAVGEEAVKTIIRGEASPDSDYRSFWRITIPATAAHIYSTHRHEDAGGTDGPSS